MKARPAKVLYVVHRSLVEPIPRLHGLDQIRSLGVERTMEVLSFEPRDRGRSLESRRLFEETRRWIEDAGVRHHRLPLLGNRWLEIPMGTMRILFAILLGGVRIVHCRSYIPALMGLLATRITPAKFLFDMRGLFVDEYVLEGAFRPGCRKLRFARWLERRLLFRADRIVVVSTRFREHLLRREDLAARIRGERVIVIPNRVDLGRFADLADERRTERARRSWQSKLVGVFVGSTAPWHRLDRTLAIARRIAEVLPNFHLLVTVYPSTDVARRMAEDAGLGGDRVDLDTALVAEIPRVLAPCDFGFMIIDNHISKQVCAPIKFAEYLAAGLPVIAGGGTGDTGSWIAEHGLGVLIDPDDPAVADYIIDFLSSPDFLTGRCSERCRAFAARELDMRQTIVEYEGVYRSLDR